MKKYTRREVLEGSVKVVAGVALAGVIGACSKGEDKAPKAALPEGLTELAPTDGLAQAMGYADDASKVDKSKYPKWAADQNCANCALYVAKGNAKWGGCSIFPGRAVTNVGWCNSWAPKVAAG